MNIQTESLEHQHKCRDRGVDNDVTLAAQFDRLREELGAGHDALNYLQGLEPKQAISLLADAERYRYLRDRQPMEVFTGRGPAAGVWCDAENELGDLELVTGDDLDAAVDAARARLETQP